MRRAAFIDRDGVINEELDYVHRIEDFHLLPGAVEGLRLLQDDGWALVVVTNQAGIGRGLYTEQQFHALTDHMRSTLAAGGVRLAGVYHCPHHPTAGIGDYRRDCACRKPRPGMLLQAADELGLDLASSVLVGDKESDLEAGQAAGCAAVVLAESGHAIDDAARRRADHVALGLLEAARWIIQSRGSQPPPPGEHDAH